MEARLKLGISLSHLSYITNSVSVWGKNKWLLFFLNTFQLAQSNFFCVYVYWAFIANRSAKHTAADNLM